MKISGDEQSRFESAVDTTALETGSSLTPKFDASGLVTAIVSDFESDELLMVAHMNAEALARTIESGQSWFWSRSRRELWHKGATSGNIQHVQEIRIDCDQDAIWLKVRVNGAASCHTGRTSCFFRRIESKNGEFTLTADPPQ